MVYVKDTKFVATLIHNGKILREFKDSDENWGFKLPFGSEYAIKFKNLNSTRVAVSVEIDGEDVLNGSRIVIEPNESHDLEGFLDNSKVKNKFKFIEKTEKISNHRGDKIDDGLIRISYQFEKPDPIVIKKTIIEQDIIKRPMKPLVDPWEPYQYPYGQNPTWTTCNSNDDDSIKPSGTFDGILRLMGGPVMDSLSEGPTMQTNNARRLSIPMENENGITVKGSQTNVSYKTTHLKEMEEQTHIMVLKLTGHKESSQAKINQAVTVKTRIECPTCGDKNKSSNKFCGGCGTCIV